MIQKKSKTVLFSLCCAAIGFSFAASVCASTPPAKAPSSAADKKIPCLDCHDDSGKVPVLSIFNTKHAAIADKRTPFAKDACQTCHGNATEHMGNPSKENAPTQFGMKSKVPVVEQNKVCLGCHESGARMSWKGSAHESAQIACASCHTVHANEDKALNKRSQSEVCFGCHKTQQAQIHRASAHPIAEGKMSCMGCHNPHGTTGPKLLIKNTLNETCYTCHAEKRGPFLWEHQPVREDCSICHLPHGSNYDSLLNAKAPWLCQQCHLESGHPSNVYSGANIPLKTVQFLGKNCMNCHSQVHGSNHPSGARKTR